MKNTFPLAARLLSLLTLAIAFVGGGSALHAQNISGTWHFTGFVTTNSGVAGSSGAIESTATRTESTITFAQVAGASGAWSATGAWQTASGTPAWTRNFTLTQQGNPNVWLDATNAGSAPISGKELSIAKLVRIDDNTFLFYYVQKLEILDSIGTLRTAAVNGVLTKAALPIKKDASWLGTFEVTVTSATASSAYSTVELEDFGQFVTHYAFSSEDGKYYATFLGDFALDSDNDGTFDNEYNSNASEPAPITTDGNFLTGIGDDAEDTNFAFQLSGGRLAMCSLNLSAGTWSGQQAAEFTVSVLIPQGSGTDDPDTGTPPATDGPVVTPVSSPEVNLTAGKSATLKVTASAEGGKKVTYQWYDADGPIAGATKASYVVKTKKGDAGAGTYYVVVSSDGGATGTTSEEFTVNVFSPPVISTQPVNKEAVENDSVSFTVGATGTGPLTYEWKLGKVTVGGNSPTLTVVASAATIGKYTVTVSNAIGKVTSKAVTLKASVRPAIVEITQGKTVLAANATLTIAAGKSAVLKVNATGTAKLTYQWYFNGTAIAKGGNSATYTVKTTKNSDAAAGTYTVKVTNAVGEVTSAPVNVQVVVPAYIAQQTTGTIKTTVGSTFELAVSAGGDGPFTYQWKFKGKDIAGATSATFVATASKDLAGSYVCEVRDTAGTVVKSKAITVKVGDRALGPQTLAAGTIVSTIDEEDAEDGYEDSITIASATEFDTYGWEYLFEDITGDYAVTVGEMTKSETYTFKRTGLSTATFVRKATYQITFTYEGNSYTEIVTAEDKADITFTTETSGTYKSSSSFKYSLKGKGVNDSDSEKWTSKGTFTLTLP
jgi:hypothetical protein